MFFFGIKNLVADWKFYTYCWSNFRPSIFGNFLKLVVTDPKATQFMVSFVGLYHNFLDFFPHSFWLFFLLKGTVQRDGSGKKSFHLINRFKWRGLEIFQRILPAFHSLRALWSIWVPPCFFIANWATNLDVGGKIFYALGLNLFFHSAIYSRKCA